MPAPGSSGGGRPHAYDKAKERAREAAEAKRRAAYIPLACGHLTTWDLDELYSAWRPGKRKYYCETCGSWKEKKKTEVKTYGSYPDNPLF